MSSFNFGFLKNQLQTGSTTSWFILVVCVSFFKKMCFIQTKNNWHCVQFQCKTHFSYFVKVSRYETFFLGSLQKRDFTVCKSHKCILLNNTLKFFMWYTRWSPPNKVFLFKYIISADHIANVPTRKSKEKEAFKCVCVIKIRFFLLGNKVAQDDGQSL